MPEPMPVAATMPGLAAGATAGRWLGWRARGRWTGAKKLSVPGAKQDDED